LPVGNEQDIRLSTYYVALAEPWGGMRVQPITIVRSDFGFTVPTTAAARVFRFLQAATS
jgi:hypothetical protein